MANANTEIERLPNREDMAGIVGTLQDIHDAITPGAFSWANASNEKIVELVQKAYTGEVDLSNDFGWAVGDERVVRLNAVSAGADHIAYGRQEATLVLMDTDHFYLADGVTKCKFVVGFKDCLDEIIHFQDTDDNTISWEDSRARKECDAVFTMFPDYIKSILKKFVVYSSRGYDYSGGIDIYSNSYLAIPSVIELGLGDNSPQVMNPIEYDYMSAFSYYNVASNRIKNVTGTADYWSRSPYYGEGTGWIWDGSYHGIRASNGGRDGPSGAFTHEDGLSPFGVI